MTLSFFSVSALLHGHWRKIGQQWKGKDHLCPSRPFRPANEYSGIYLQHSI